MNPELQKKLWESYPQIFSSTQDDAGEWTGLYIECGDGWFNIVDNLCRNIQHAIDWNNATGEFSRFSAKEELIEQVVADQIKEKYGGLRFYYHGGVRGDNEVLDFVGMVNMAEVLSYKICESCGKRATSRSSRYLQTLCVHCFSHLESKRQASAHESACSLVIPNTVIACGEENNFCSEDCMNKAAGELK